MSSPNKSRDSDPLTTTLLKACLDSLITPITNMINASPCSGMFQDDFKQAHVSPLLKKTSLSKGCFGVPQGSVLGPLFLQSTCLGLNHVFEHHQLRHHMYADDTQLYVEFSRDQPAHATTVTDRISRCTADVKSWMVSHNLLLNKCKTEAVVISAVQNRKRVQPPVDLVIDVCGCSVTPKPFIRDIGFL